MSPARLKTVPDARWSVTLDATSGFERIFLQGSHQASEPTWHSHPGPQVCLVRRGSGVVMIAAASPRAAPLRWSVSPGDVVTIPGRRPHGWCEMGERGLDVLALTLTARRAGSPADASVAPLLQAGRLRIEADRPPFAGWIHAIEQEGAAERFGRVEAVAALGRCLLVALAREALTRDDARAGSAAIVRARAFIAENLARPVGVPEVARAAGLSVSQATRRFRAEVGESIPDAIRRLRLDRARHLLATTEGSLAEVAAATGLGCAQHLCRVFRAALGTTPQAYRRDHAPSAFA